MDREKPSSTALVIAKALSLLAAKPETAALVTPEQRILAEWVLQNYSTQTRWTAASLHRPWVQAFCRGLERATIPGIIEHYARRKQALEKLALRAIADGAQQVVVLGAGFDMLATRLGLLHPEVKTLEVDHPNTQRWKERGLQAMGTAVPALAPADLSDPDRLLQVTKYLSPDKTILWVAEGLLMYFTEEGVRKVFANVRKLSPTGSRFAFTYMEPDQNGRVNFTRKSGLLNRWLAHVKEPFAWGIQREMLPGFLAESGWKNQAVEPEIVSEVTRLNVGEYVALAQV